MMGKMAMMGPSAAGPRARAEPCHACHAPRFVATAAGPIARAEPCVHAESCKECACHVTLCHAKHAGEDAQRLLPPSPGQRTMTMATTMRMMISMIEIITMTTMMMATLVGTAMTITTAVRVMMTARR